MRAVFLSLLTILCLLLAVAPAMADVPFYNNGAPNFNVDAWAINFGFSVSDSFDTSRCGAGGCTIADLQFAVWLFPGDAINQVGLSIGTTSFGADAGIGSVTTTTLVDLGTNDFGFDSQIVQNGVPLTGFTECEGSCWLTLFNAVVTNGDPVFWDENNGPSLAFENSVGSIPSEAFSLSGHPCGGPAGCRPTPEPSSIVLFGSGILGLACVLRRKLTR